MNPRAPATSQEPPPHIPALDGVRGCAILLVLASHLAEGVAAASRFDEVVLQFWRAGWIGVDLFFVLSGFLITGILLDSRGDPRYFAAFFARRALRILPLYWLFLIVLVGAAGFLRSGPQWGAMIASLPWHLAHASNVLVAFHGWNAAALQTGHLWSLAVEEQFYLTWPLVIFAVGARRLRNGIARMLLYLPAVRGFALAAGLFAVTVHVLTPFRADALGAGALLALLIRDDNRAQLLHRLRVAGALAIGVLAVIMIAIRGLPYTSVWVQTLGYSALAIAFATFIERALRAAPGSPADRTLGNPLLRSFGRYSYSIYLFHAPVLLAVDAVFGRRTSLPIILGSRIPALIAFAVTFAGMMWLVGFTTWWTFERHFLALKRHFAYAPRAAPPIAASARAA